MAKLNLGIVCPRLAAFLGLPNLFLPSNEESKNPEPAPLPLGDSSAEVSLEPALEPALEAALDVEGDPESSVPALESRGEKAFAMELRRSRSRDM